MVTNLVELVSLDGPAILLTHAEKPGQVPVVLKWSHWPKHNTLTWISQGDERPSVVPVDVIERWLAEGPLTVAWQSPTPWRA